MDNLCHTLAGAALADAGLARQTAMGMGTLLIASNLPDVDVLVFATDTLPMAFRRGWTHGVLAMAVLPAMLAGVMFAVHRWRARGRAAPDRHGRAVNLPALLLLSYLGTWLHVFMDYLNTYGVRLLMPFSERWFYGDSLYIVDPFLYAALGGAVALGRVRWRGFNAHGRRIARAGVAVAGVYTALMMASNAWARSEVRRGLERAGQPATTRFMVTPVVGNPLRREVLVDMGDRYEKGFLWFEPQPHFRPAGYGVDRNAGDPAAQRAAQTPVGQAYLRWSRFPFFVVRRTADRTLVQLNDYRYAGPGGRDTWLAVTIEVPSIASGSGDPGRVRRDGLPLALLFLPSVGESIVSGKGLALAGRPALHGRAPGDHRHITGDLNRDVFTRE